MFKIRGWGGQAAVCLLTVFLAFAAIFALSSPALACATCGDMPLWGTSVSAEDLTGSRSACWNGVTAIGAWSWDFEISWDISFSDDTGLWTYNYYLSVDKPDVSHFILEVTMDGSGLSTYPGTSTPLEEEQWWTRSPSNPNLPNPIYGVKFDFGGDDPTYTIVTDRAPVWGVFYAKGGGGWRNNGEAWSSALNAYDYWFNTCLTETSFIVRPDGLYYEIDPPLHENPLPGSVLLFGSGLLGLVFIQRRRKG